MRIYTSPQYILLFSSHPLRCSVWQGGLVMVLCNILYGCTYVAYNAWLPFLAASEPEVLATPAGPAREAAFAATMDRISSAGFAWGYFGSVLVLLACVGITFALSDDTVLAYR